MKSESSLISQTLLETKEEQGGGAKGLV